MDAETHFSDLDKIRVSLRDGGKTVMTFGLGLSLVLRKGETPAKRAAFLDVMEAYAARAAGRVTH